jgi:hypothetical protein
MSLNEYTEVVTTFISKGGKQINLLGGEPLLHPNLRELLDINRGHGIKTTIYTNGNYLYRYSDEDFKDVKLRVSVYSMRGETKSVDSFLDASHPNIPIDICFMVSKNTTLDELLESACELETWAKCRVFFISSLRELDNPNQEFFEDTEMSMPVMEYKKLVHDFLDAYDGAMRIHVSKRGVFESTVGKADCKCRFANYFIGGKVIQCPFDIVNEKYQDDYEFENRYCQHNSTCLMSKVIYFRHDSGKDRCC